MSGHRSWQSYHEHRLRMMTKLQYETFKAIQRYEREKILHQTWLVGVEGWLSRALNDARLGQVPESLAWPVRTIPELNTLAAREYPACAAPDDDGFGKFARMTYDEIRREANVMLLMDYIKIIDDGLPDFLRSTETELREWAENFYDQVVTHAEPVDDWPEWEHDDRGRSPDDPHYGHEHE